VQRACEDDPRRCTGRRLVSLGLAEEFRGSHRPPSGVLLLDPHAGIPLSGEDRTAAHASGILVVDCSWNRLGARAGFPPGLPRPPAPAIHRRLPFLLAGNPQHFGRIGELNTAEALGAGLYLTFGAKEAEAFFLRLSGGRSFLELNQERLRAYGACPGPAEVRSLERSFFP
jgi:pre-rRNA-processing protein TSR3